MNSLSSAEQCPATHAVVGRRRTTHYCTRWVHHGGPHRCALGHTWTDRDTSGVPEPA